VQQAILHKNQMINIVFLFPEQIEITVASSVPKSVTKSGGLEYRSGALSVQNGGIKRQAFCATKKISLQTKFAKHFGLTFHF
jgi:hypothetical protein